MTTRFSLRAAGLVGALLGPASASAAPYMFALPDGVDAEPAPGVVVASWWDVSEHRWVVAPGWGGGATKLAVIFPITPASEVGVSSATDAAMTKLMQTLGPTAIEVTCEDLYPFVDRRDTSDYRDYGDEEDEHPRLRHTQPGPLACDRSTPYRGYYGYGYEYDYDTEPYYPNGYGDMTDGDRVDSVTGPDLLSAKILETAGLADVAAVEVWLAERTLTLAEPLVDVAGGKWLAVVYDVTDDDVGRLPSVLIDDRSMSHLRVDVGDGDTDLVVYQIGEAAFPSAPQAIVPLALEEVMLDSDCLFDDDTVDARYEAALATAAGAPGTRALYVFEHLSNPNQCIGCAGLPDLATSLTSLGWTSDLGPFNTAITRVRLIVDAGAGVDTVGWQQLEPSEARYTAFVAWRQELESDFPVCGVGFVDDPASCLDGETARRARPGSRSGAVGTLGFAALGLAAVIAGRRRARR